MQPGAGAAAGNWQCAGWTSRLLGTSCDKEGLAGVLASPVWALSMQVAAPLGAKGQELTASRFQVEARVELRMMPAGTAQGSVIAGCGVERRSTGRGQDEDR